MKRVAFITVIGIMSLVAVAAFASDLKKPRITPQQGQTKEQQKKDAEECYVAAVDSTGVDPEILEIRMRGAESMRDRAARPMPGPGRSLTVSPGQYSQASGYQDKVKEIEKEYGIYQSAFTESMEARGYKVKW